MKMLGLLQSARFCIGVACAVQLGGCSEYLDRRETIRMSAGEAVQNNVAMHVIDPWPRQAFMIPRTTNGERSQRAVERYRNPGAGAGSNIGSAQTGTPVLRDQPQPKVF